MDDKGRWGKYYSCIFMLHFRIAYGHLYISQIITSRIESISRDHFPSRCCPIMKWTDKIESYGSSRPFYTFEFFPPRTDQVSTGLTLSGVISLTAPRVSQICFPGSRD